MKIEIRHATPDDIELMARSMREVDRREAFYQCGVEAKDALWRTFERSHLCKAGFANGELVNVWGAVAANALAGEANPWMVATPAIEKVPVPFLRRCCYYVNELQDGVDFLYNYVCSENVLAIQWLKWMGFEMFPARPHGPYGVMFHPFAWERPHVL